MKKTLLSAFVATIVLITSCSKDKTPEPEKKDETLYSIAFNVSTFKSEIIPMAIAKNKPNKIAYQGNGLGGQNFQAAGTGDDWLGNKIYGINYYVYNETGTLVNQITQMHQNEYQVGDGWEQEPNLDFGRIEDTLPAGKYRIVFVTNYMNFYGDYTYGVLRIYQDPESYAKAIDITVTDKNLEQSVLLDRVVGKLEIKLLDQTPENIDRITFSVSKISESLYLYGGIHGTNSKIERTVSTARPDYKDNMHLYFTYQGSNGSTAGNADVNIRAYGKEENLVIDKIIKDIPVGINKTTILSGKLFEDAGTSKRQGFSIALQDKWLESEQVSF